NDEFKVGYRDGAQLEVFHPGCRGLCPATDALQIEVERKRIDLEIEFGRGGRREHAVEGAAIKNEPRLCAVDYRGDDGLQTIHRHRQFDELAENAFARRVRRSAAGPRHDRNEHPFPSAHSPRIYPCSGPRYCWRCTPARTAGGACADRGGAPASARITSAESPVLPSTCTELTVRRRRSSRGFQRVWDCPGAV